MPRPEMGSLVMWQNLGGLQPSPFCALVRSRRSWPLDRARSYSSPFSTNKHSWCPLSFIFLATWFIKKCHHLAFCYLCRGFCEFDNAVSASYLGVRNIINIAVVDLQKPVSILKAAAARHPSWHHISDDVTLASFLHPQMEAVGLPLLSLENTQTRAGRWHRVWARRDRKVRPSPSKVSFIEDNLYASYLRRLWWPSLGCLCPLLDWIWISWKGREVWGLSFSYKLRETKATFSFCCDPWCLSR